MGGTKRRVGILTAGGDCPGLNVVLRAVVKTLLLGPGIETVGFRDGFGGLVEDDAEPLGYESVSNLLTRGGTILGTSNTAHPLQWVDRANPGAAPVDRGDDVLANVRRRGLEGLVVIGGDGTMAISGELHARGVPIVGVPKTIDNDLRGTDLTFGFRTAVQTAVDAIDKIHDTAMSHHRVMVVELMGRYAGWIALEAGVAGGADIILLPEIPYDLDAVCEKIRFRSHKGRRFTIVAVAEGARPKGGDRVVERIVQGSPDPIRLGGIGQKLAHDVQDATGLVARATVLGHVQRGGTPVPEDRVLCTRFGHVAAEHVTAGRYGCLVGYRGGEVVTAPLEATQGGPRLVPLDHPLIAAARAVCTSFGDEAG